MLQVDQVLGDPVLCQRVFGTSDQALARENYQERRAQLSKDPKLVEASTGVDENGAHPLGLSLHLNRTPNPQSILLLILTLNLTLTSQLTPHLKRLWLLVLVKP